MRFWPRRERRQTITATQNSPDILRVFGLESLGTSTGEPVTIDAALGVPAIWAGVNFLASTIAGLPLKVYRRGQNGREPSNPELTSILHDVANKDEPLSSFDWRKWWMEQALTGGRGVTFIDRDQRGRVVNLWPLDPARVVIKRIDGRKRYEYTDSGRTVIYEAGEVLDIAYQMMPDMVRHRSPIMTNRDVVALAIAVTRYGGAFFRGGGVPPFAITGGFRSPGAMQRAADDLDEAVRKAAKESRQALVLPEGLEIKPIGATAEDAQMVEMQRFLIEQVARIFNLPPVFLQDLTHGTFSNTEQQDLQLVKHTIKRWVEQIEGEINLKLFGRGARNYVEFSLDGLLRGDFATRMGGYAQAISSGVLKPNEAREMENRPAEPGGDVLLIQGATIPLPMAGQNGAGGSEGDVDAT